MPVPVPVHETFPAHRAAKPKDVLQVAPNPPDPRSVYNGAPNYVNHSTDQHSAIDVGVPSHSCFQGTGSNWPSFARSGSGDKPRLAFLSEGAWECLRLSKLSHGLTAADEVAISKLAHTKACPSPVSAPSVNRISMGLQHPGDRYGLGPPGAESESKGGGFHSYYQDSFPMWEPSQCIDSNAAEGNLLHPATTTPFADFVDHIVATEAAHGNDHISQNRPSLIPPIGVPSHQHQPTSTASLSNPSYIRSYRAMAEPLSEWMAGFVWKVCLEGVCLPRRFIGAGASRAYDVPPPPSLSKSIYSVLCSTLLQPSAIVLALWYITRLPVLFERQATDVILMPSELEFRKELYAEVQFCSTSSERSQLEAAASFRVALLGCMLSNKWLDDHTFSNKTWHGISEVPIRSINRLELAALAVLGHDLSITPKAWENWLAQLHRSYIPVARDHYAVARKMVMDLTQLHEQPPPRIPSMAPEQPTFSALVVVDVEVSDDVYQGGSFDPFEIDLDEDGPLREEYVPKRRSTLLKTDAVRRMDTAGTSAFGTQSPRLSLPSEWDAHVDPASWTTAKSDGISFVLPVSTAASVCFRGPAQHTYSHMTSWGAQTEVKQNAVSSLPRHPEFPNGQVNFGFFGHAFALPPPSCSSAGHGRTSSCSASVAHETYKHMRSYSQTLSSNDTGLPPSIPCSRYAEQAAPISQGQGYPGYFQPMWLKI